MVNRLKLNEKALRNAELRPGVSYQIFDTEVIGFAVRVQSSGARTFTIDYRHAGRQRRMNIGRWPDWSVTAARERAKELRRAIDEGRDPLAVREDFREAPRVKDMIDRYIAEHLPKLAKNNAGDQISMLRKMLEPAWGNKLVTEITKSDVARFLDFVAEGRPRPSKAKPNNRARKLQGHKPTPIRANRMGEVLRKMFTLAMEWEWRTDNPAQGFHRRIEQARERFLGPEELTRIAAVLDNAEDQRGAAIIRMCMLTGARVGEVRTARFEQFNLDYAIWSKPAATTKQRKIHRVPISQEVVTILRQRQLIVPNGNPWLFPGETVGQPVREIRRFWARVQYEADLPDVRIHDLRHTFASLLVSGGASLEMIGRLLGHSQMQTTQRYAHLMDSPLRAGVDTVASILRPRPRLVHGAAQDEGGLPKSA
ncbi:tyrosine-type recombinase/integrase [Roseicitreum antarcticum]|uniref:Site-specific recombinase XerD n=1 Tax=Roseicitreum antarcticum TaxID=564137 RepID=A0A1H3FA23_9RHOB|nr:site-specific integrase [Roseicitreum antarcticum]SDX87822.1 Site-specific recombinase XerD [Roseicitreum antarcticum]